MALITSEVEIELPALIANDALFDRWLAMPSADQLEIRLVEDDELADRLFTFGDELAGDPSAPRRLVRKTRAAGVRWCTSIRIRRTYERPGFPPPSAHARRAERLDEEWAAIEQREHLFAQGFFTSARARSGQFYTSLSGPALTFLYLKVTAASGQLLLERYSPMARMVGNPLSALDEAVVQGAGADAVGGNLPWEFLVRSIIGDAAYVNSTDPRYGVLLAGIGLEVQVKSLLEQPTKARPVEVRAAIDSRQKTVELFDEPLRLVTGKSLRAFNAKLYADLGAIFAERSAVAHQGKPKQLSRKRANKLLDSARRASDWMNSLVGKSDLPALSADPHRHIRLLITAKYE
jgi:hypothetical protein